MNKDSLPVTKATNPIAGIACFALVLLASTSASGQWRIEPAVGIGGERDDNATMSIRTDDVVDVTGLLLEGSARFNYESSVTDFFITPRIRSSSYSDNPEIDSDDFFVESIFRRASESSIFRLRFNYDDQTVRTAERAETDFDIDNPDDIPEDDSGFVRFQDHRKKIRFQPEWIYRFGESSAVALRASYVDTSYDGELQAFLADYSDLRFEAAYRKGFSERTTGVVMATGRNYEVDDGSSETTGIGFLAGVERALSPTTTGKILIGVEDTDSNLSDAGATFVVDANLRRRLETVNLIAQYRRTVSASGVGKLSVRDSLNLNMSRRLSDKISAGLGVRAYQTNSLDSANSIDERNYVQLRGQFVWDLTPSLATEVNYRYTFQDRSVLGESANSNQVTIWFVYRPNSIDRRFGTIATDE